MNEDAVEIETRDEDRVGPPLLPRPVPRVLSTSWRRATASGDSRVAPRRWSTCDCLSIL